MYLEYFDLKRHPFRITPDPSLFCPGGGRGEILEALIYAITSGEGIVKVVGEVGSGKTMLCRILEERLPTSVEIVYLANPRLTPHDILYAIAFELKLPVDQGTERLLVMQQLQAYLLAQHAVDRSVVVFVEEAQGMALETLEEIRLLSNLETHRHKLLQIVLFGQPELEKNLRRRDIRQLRERITHSFHLTPLTKAETSEYLRFRLQAAGCGKAGVFSSGAERLIAKVSCGLIRRINILADKAMLAAYADSAGRGISNLSRAMVHSRHVRAAIRDSEFRPPFYRSAWCCSAGAVLLLVLLVLALGWDRLDFMKDFLRVENTKGRVSAGQALQAETDLRGYERHSGIGGGEVSLHANNPDEVNVPAVNQDSAAESQPVAVVPSSAGGVADSASVASLPATVMPSSQGVEDAGETAGQGRPGVANAKNDGNMIHPPVSAPVSSLEISGKEVMAQRHEACRQWVQKVEITSYTIQLMEANLNNELEVERYLRQVSSSALLGLIYVCPVPFSEDVLMEAGGDGQRWVVVYGDFSRVSSARKAIESLPQEIRRYQPFVRRLDDVLWIRNAGIQG